MPKEKIEAEKVKSAFEKFRNLLTEREREIITCFYGIDSKVRHSLRELGEHFMVTRERIRQIKTEALKKLKIKNLKNNN